MSSDLGDNSRIISNIERQIQILKELRESVRSTSEHTQKQLQNIDKQNLLFTSIAFILPILTLFGLGSIYGFLKIVALYWIPASFLLWFLWLIYGAFAFQKALQTMIPKKLEITDDEKKIKREWFNKTVISPIIGIFFLYLLTLFFLLLIQMNLISVEKQINIIIPFIAVIFFLLLPFIIKINEKTDKREISLSLLLPAIIIAFVIALVLPFLAFIESLQWIQNYSQLDFWIFFGFIEICQVFLILISTSSVSGFIASFEMNNITDLSQVNFRVLEITIILRIIS